MSTEPKKRIRLLEDLPIAAKHGAKKGREFDVIEVIGPLRRSMAKFWFMGDAGEKCAAFGNEVEDIP